MSVTIAYTSILLFILANPGAYDISVMKVEAGLVVKMKKMLTEMTFDASIEGTEAEKNAFLSPALPVPALEREVAHAQGKAVGLGNAPPEPHLLNQQRTLS